MFGNERGGAAAGGRAVTSGWGRPRAAAHTGGTGSNGDMF